MKKVHCLGILVVDALSGPIRQYPVPKHLTQVISPNLCIYPGGGAANSSSALAQLGIPVGVFSKIGGDLNGRYIIDELRRKGVDTNGVCVSDTDTTPYTFVGIHEDGDRTFIHTPGANKSFVLDDLDQKKLLDCDFLLYQDFWVLPKIDGKPGAELLREARSRGIVTFLDECWGLGPEREKWEMMLPYVDYVLPSLDDMKYIYPKKDEAQIIRHLLALGCRNVVLKMGERGCCFGNGSQYRVIPASPTEIVDTTGAGDCFDAGFIAGLVKGLSVTEAAATGCRAAAAAIRSRGGAEGIPLYDNL